MGRGGGVDGESKTEWTTVQHLDLRHVGRGLKPLQPHAAVFHPTQAIVAVAIGTYIIEFDALTGCKICSVNVGARVVRMSYSPTAGHAIISILEDSTIQSCDFDTEQTLVLHSPEKRSDQVSSETEVHLALTPLQPVVFFGFHRRMSVTVVGTIEGGRAPTKIKTDLKKPIANLACHPRFLVLYVAYADGLIRAYDIQTYAVLYTLQVDNTIKLIGAGAFAFHPTLEWMFVGDRRGTLLAWDVSTDKPSMIGIIQVGSHPITSVAWLPRLRLLATVSKDGSLQVWKTRVVVNANRKPLETEFFEHADVKSIDIPQILSLQDGESIYPLPRIKNIAVHPKLNLAAMLFADVAPGNSLKSTAAHSREGRKQLFAVLQSARGSTATVLKEKLSSLGSSGILADHQLQTQLQEYNSKGQSQLTIADIARKAFLYSHFMEGHAKSGPITRLPLLTISDPEHQLKDIPVCLPFHLELNFFNKENRVLQYPVRAFYVDEVNLMSYNLSSGVDNLYKKLYHPVPGNVEFLPQTIVYSSKQHIFLVVFEIRSANSTIREVVIYREQTDVQSVNSKMATIKGRDVALIGIDENQYAILDDDDKTGIILYTLTIPAPAAASENNGALDANSFSEEKADHERAPVQFSFDSEVDCIFSSPLESTILYVINGKHIGMAKLIPGYRLSSDGSQYITTKTDGKKSIKLKLNEIVLQVQWQETLRGHIAGILTSQRIVIVSKELDILSSSTTKSDRGFPSFRSLLWVGPALLFSSATGISMLGWDSKVRTILSSSMPCSALLGVLNDRILLVNPTDINPRQKKGVEIRSCLIGLLEPLLIGFVTMQQYYEQKLDISEILYQITSRFDSLRITPRSLDILANGPPVCGDLAVSLSQAGPQFTQVLRCIYAIKARRFSTALSVLKDEFLRSRDYPQCPPTSHLFHRFRQLGYACIKYGQFDSAKETFGAIADYHSMLDLFVCHFNPSALRGLAQKLEEDDTDSELRRYCERILRVRSSGWTQGIFANFAAESMVPKGPEWGGGNWEIKTPSNPKAIPQWELAGEVMPYMRTSESSIPSIIPEHIGVYLGAIKGRESIVEVSETSLVKTFLATKDGNKGNNLPSSLLNSAGKMNTNMTGDTKDDSIMNILSRQLAGASSSRVDEQAKAAEEFKNYGRANGSSSDEDESMSKTKKFHIKIRERPVAATVDVNKIKEATKQFKLGEAPMRTRTPSGGSQDLSLIFGQPITTTTTTTGLSTSTASASFGTETTAQAEASAMATGMGVSAGPIPEDFFQNTISSLQVVASMPTPPSYVNRSNQSTSDVDGSKILPNQMGKTIDIGLPDGGVPPQASQPSILSEMIGLPDGGVPPQSVIQAPRPPSTTQALDLSVLEAPGSITTTSSIKATTELPLAPSSVRPGQVPRGASASICFKTGLVHLEQNQLTDALSCLDEAFLALAKDQSCGADIKAQATICAQYKIAVAILQEITRLQKVQGANAISAKDEMARLSRHLGSLPLLAKHRISCIRTAIKRNMEVQNYGYAKEMLELLLSKAPSSKQDELRSLVDMCIKRGLSNKSIDPLEDPSQFCAGTLSRLSTIGHDMCDLCGAKFSALASPGCIICGMGSIKRSDSSTVMASSPFG